MTKGKIKVDYDPSVDMMYIQIAEGRYKASRKAGEGVLADINNKGKIIGFEIFSASKTAPELVEQFKNTKELSFTAV